MSETLIEKMNDYSSDEDDEVVVFLDIGFCNSLEKKSSEYLKESEKITEENVSFVNPFASNTFNKPIKHEEKVIVKNPLEKTKMCRNIETYGKCTRRICTFAHSKEELRPLPCSHGINCKYKMCPFAHPEKTKEDFPPLPSRKNK